MQPTSEVKEMHTPSNPKQLDNNLPALHSPTVSTENRYEMLNFVNENGRVTRHRRKQNLKKIKENPNFTLNPIPSKILEIKESFPVEHQYAKMKNKNGKS
uniref:Uncharacterized protein n=1 Tax=Cacopsylla melanoneura TaxID=428564 RepID=A0A8D9E9K0_9HEMI